MKARYRKRDRDTFENDLLQKPMVEPVIRISESFYHDLKTDISDRALRQGAIQGIAAILLGLSKHGYGKKRLQDALNWAQEILQSPKVFDREITADNVLDYLDEKFDIKVDNLEMKIEPNFAYQVAEEARKGKSEDEIKDNF